MTLVRVGGSLSLPSWPWSSAGQQVQFELDQPRLDLLSERAVLIGSVFWADGNAHAIRTVHFRTGNASLSGTVTVSLRDVDLTTGPVGRDDGTADQSGTIVNPAATTSYSVTLSADRTVAPGVDIAVVFDITAYTSGAFVPVGLHNNGLSWHRPLASLYTGTWAQTPTLPSLTFEAADGTFGIMVGGIPRITAMNIHTFNSDSAADEIALAFTPSVPMTVGSAGFFVTPVAGGDFDLVLYRGTTVLASYSVDASTWAANGIARPVVWSFAEVTLTPGVTYYLALKPTTITNVTTSSMDVSTAAHLQVFTACRYSSRVNGGAWAGLTDTRVPYAWLGVTALDDGASRSGIAGMVVGSGRW